MTGSMMPRLRRGTEPYAVAHAREVASRWDLPVMVARRGDTFFCALAGTPLDDLELVGRAVAGGRMFVYEGTPAMTLDAGRPVTAPPLAVVG